MSKQVPAFPRGLSRSAWRAGVIAVVTTAITLSAMNAVWAKDQPTKANNAPAEKSYILPYILVGLCMAFGIMVVCRPASRADKEKLSAKEEFEEGH